MLHHCPLKVFLCYIRSTLAVLPGPVHAALGPTLAGFARLAIVGPNAPLCVPRVCGPLARPNKPLELTRPAGAQHKGALGRLKGMGLGLLRLDGSPNVRHGMAMIISATSFWNAFPLGLQSGHASSKWQSVVSGAFSNIIAKQHC